ncbi:unnamed protein product [Ectocarpus sp. 12 AP-2014]
MTRISSVIQDGDPDQFRALLAAVNGEKAVELLTETYGGEDIGSIGPFLGSYDLGLDKDGLFRETSPLLHAARAGRVAMWLAVLDAMKSKNVSQVFAVASGTAHDRSLFNAATVQGQHWPCFGHPALFSVRDNLDIPPVPSVFTGLQQGNRP